MIRATTSRTLEQADSPSASPSAKGPDPAPLRGDDPASRFARAELYGHQLASAPSPGHPLPPPIQRKMERALGADFSSVRVHHGQHVELLGASAYTRGERIHFAPGQYRPHAPEGQATLGHELAHVIQQREGRARRGADNALNEDTQLEAEADRLGASAARHLDGGFIRPGS